MNWTMVILVIAIIVAMVGAGVLFYGFVDDRTIHKIIGGCILLVALLAGGWSLTTPGVQKSLKHLLSDTQGLQRTIEQYDYTGKLINKYEGNIMVEVVSGGVSFLDNDGNEVKLIGGVITVKEK